MRPGPRSTHAREYERGVRTNPSRVDDWRHMDLRQRAWMATAVIGALFIAAFFALPQGSVEQSAVYDACGLAMVFLAFLGIRAHRPSGWLPWLILIAGQLAFVFGDIIWTFYQANGENPFP